jgi:MGT family glycosyltransferase
MPNALFFNIPAQGHINPSLPLVTELIRRGHDITYFITEGYRAAVEAAGATVQIYASVADEYFESRGLNGTEPQKAAHALLTTTKTILPDLLEKAQREQPDYILYDCMCPWGYYLAKILRLPSVSAFSLMPLTMQVMRDLRLLRLFLPSMIRDFRLGAAVNRLAQDLGEQYDVRPLGRIEVLNARGDLSISFSSSAYVPYAKALPDNFRFVGWTMQENPSDEAFTHETEQPLIYISLGTLSNDNPTFYRHCIEAFGDLPYAVLISTGRRFSPEQFRKLPPQVTIKSWVPQTQVLRQASLFITHGGLNSLHDGLYCGLPLLIVPQQTEQTFNGLRVVDLGAGLMLKADEVSASSLGTTATRLLSEGRYKAAAERISATLRTGGAARAVDEVEVLLRKR